MTNIQAPDAGDYRRAAVLTLHHRRGNTAGVLAIVDETNIADRAVQLLFAVLGFHKHLILRLRTGEGIDLLADYVHGIATIDAPADDLAAIDMLRAAQILDQHGHNDANGIAQVMNAATADGRPTETFLRLLDHYEVALPELTSAAGIAWLEAQAAALAGEEHRPNDQDPGGGSPS
ncbi:hypothetical protein [Mycobacterium avium]|uniref:hypothetical protein n=1 Tax=Mycobacterium avium TaxID=1764 RepID=UPI000CE306C2|nr:hypothetical protein [Mycobacterium avium]